MVVNADTETKTQIGVMSSRLAFGILCCHSGNGSWRKLRRADINLKWVISLNPEIELLDANSELTCPSSRFKREFTPTFQA